MIYAITEVIAALVWGEKQEIEQICDEKLEQYYGQLQAT